MGGLGSGRRKDRTRKTVESYWTLDVNQLSEKGCLRPGWSGTCQWINNNEVTVINLRAELSASVFPMLSGSGMGDGKTLSIRSPSYIYIVGSAAAVPISSALGLETVLVADGA